MGPEAEGAGTPPEAEGPGAAAELASAEASALAASSGSEADWNRDEATSSPDVAGLFTISPFRGVPGALPSEGISLPSEDMSATLEWKGFPAEEESMEDPLIRGKDIHTPSMITATVPPITYWVAFDLRFWIFIITPPRSPCFSRIKKLELFLTQSCGRSGQS
jgi:hypothetical protein